MVLLDNRIAGTTPLLIDSLQQGRHIIVVTKEGFCSAADTLETVAGELKEHAVTLLPECVLSVESEPSEAAVYINGVFRGRAPVRIGQLASGKYTVLVTRRDFERWTDTVDLVATLPANLKAVLKTSPATISVIVPDSSVEVFVNNVSTGFGSRRNFTLPSGDVSVKAWQKSTGEVVEGHYYLPPSGKQIFKADFDRPSNAAFWYSLIFPGAGQFLNGSRIKGVAIALGFGAALVSVAANQNNISTWNADLDLAMNDYHSARYSPDAVALRGHVQSSYDEARTAFRARNISIGIAAGIYIVSALDALFFHDTVTELVSIDNDALSLSNSRSTLPSGSITVTMKVPL